MKGGLNKIKMTIKSIVENIKNPQPKNVANVLETEEGYKLGDENKEQVEEPTEVPEQVSEQVVAQDEMYEILSSRIDPEYGFVYEIRSNNPNLHLGLCKITQ